MAGLRNSFIRFPYTIALVRLAIRLLVRNRASHSATQINSYNYFKELFVFVCDCKSAISFSYYQMFSKTI